MFDHVGMCDGYTTQAALHLKPRLRREVSAESVTGYFQAMQRMHPFLSEMRAVDEGYLLEEEAGSTGKRLLGVEPGRAWSAATNPETLAEADALHRSMLKVAPAHLDVSSLVCESVDLAQRWEFVCEGPHDQIVAESLASSSAFGSAMRIPGARVLNFEPSILFALDEECRLQARLHVQTRTNAFEMRTGKFKKTPIAVNFSVRQYWAKSGRRDFLEAFEALRLEAEKWVADFVVPEVIAPLAMGIRSSEAAG